MTIEIRVPQLPESVSDATIAGWLFSPGQAVTAGTCILELETDKVVLEVPAPEDGVLVEIKGQEGDTVVADDVLATFEPGAAASVAESSSSAVEQAASPSVRKELNENDLSVNDVVATGKNGRVTKEDVSSHLQAAAPAPTPAPQKAATPVTGGREEERVPMTRLRKRIAERLLEAQSQSAILTTFNDIDLSNVMRIRKQYQDRFIKQHDVKLGFMSFFIKAATEALKRYPDVNARIDGSDIVYQGFYDVGVAVSTERGLVVPIIRNADMMSLAAIEKSITDFATRARDGRLEMDELTGGTFSVTNGGTFGSMLSTPILNTPQSAILGMHRIEQRPVVVDGEIVARPMMYLALSYDHRIIDGKTSVTFLRTIKELLEDPASMLLEI